MNDRFALHAFRVHALEVWGNRSDPLSLRVPRFLADAQERLAEAMTRFHIGLLLPNLQRANLTHTSPTLWAALLTPRVSFLHFPIYLGQVNTYPERFAQIPALSPNISELSVMGVIGLGRLSDESLLRYHQREMIFADSLPSIGRRLRVLSIDTPSLELLRIIGRLPLLEHIRINGFPPRLFEAPSEIPHHEPGIVYVSAHPIHRSFWTPPKRNCHLIADRTACEAEKLDYQDTDQAHRS